MLNNPVRCLVTHLTVSLVPVTLATCSALLMSTLAICSCWVRLGLLKAYWIMPMRGAMLSAVAWPAAMMASLMVHSPVLGSMASLVYLVVVCIRHTASNAHGALAFRGRSSAFTIHFSGSSHSKTKAAFQ